MIEDRFRLYLGGPAATIGGDTETPDMVILYVWDDKDKCYELCLYKRVGKD